MSQSRERLIAQLSSSIFSPDMPSEDISFKPTKRLAKDNSAESFSHGMKRYGTPTSFMLRPLDHSSNDLFGDSPSDFYKKNLESSYVTAGRLKKQEKKSAKIIGKPPKKEIIIKEKTEEIPKNMSPQKLNIRASSEVKIREKIQPNVIPKSEDVRIENIMIKGLKPNDDEISIKELCKGVHIVEINPSIDNVTGNCSGNAQLKIRSYHNSSNLDKFKEKLIKKGLEVSDINSSIGKKNNYHCAGVDFLDSQLQQEEKRLVCNNLTSSERKRALLGTSDDLFGNSPGTGK